MLHRLFPIAVLFTLFSCSSRFVLIPRYDVTVFENGMVSTGHNEASPGSGYGGVIYESGSAVTYPSLYLTNSDPVSGSSAILLGGFNVTKKDIKIKKAYLILSVNYSAETLKDVSISISPILKYWEEGYLSYKFIEDAAPSDSGLKKDFYFNIDKTPVTYKYDSVPFSVWNTSVTFDITGIVKGWTDGSVPNYGLAIRTAARGAPGYKTVTNKDMISDVAMIEFIPVELFDWNGTVPSYFRSNSGTWKKLKNNAFNKVELTPRIIVEY